MNDSWVPFLIGLTAVALWSVVIVRALRRIHDRVVPPYDARIVIVATLTIVAVCLSVSALSRTDSLSIAEGRVAADTARLALLIGAVLTLWTSRTKETT